MKLISVIIFYSDKAEESTLQQEKPLHHRLPKKETKLGSRILQLKYELANFPFGQEHPGNPQAKDSGYNQESIAVEMDPVLVPPPVKLKTECCEKYLKGKRCGRCPCFDLPNGPASRLN